MILRRIGFLLALLFTGPLVAQTPAPLANPNLNLLINGSVRAITRLQDGSVVLGGLFTSINGVPRANVAKLQPDGTLDPTWNPSVDYAVYALAADPSGNVYIGGNFFTVGGQHRVGLAKVSGSGAGTVDVNWNPAAGNIDAVTNAIAIDASGNVYVGGWFTTLGGQARTNIAKVSASGTGAADPSWNPSADSDVYALAIDGSGNVFAGGFFTNIGGAAHSYLAKLSGSGAGAADATWNPSPSYAVNSLVADANGNVYVGGFFASVGGRSRNYIAKLSGSGVGAVDRSWNPSANGFVYALTLDTSGSVYAAGHFSAIGGQNRNFIAKLSSSGTGAADANWSPSADNYVFALAADPNGKIYAGGDFTNIGGQIRASFAALTTSGAAAATTADAEIPGTTWAIASQPGGGVIVGGDFYKANGIPRNHILRLNGDGTLDTNWNPSANGIVDALAIDASGNVYAGGYFTAIGGQSRAHIARLAKSGTGAADPSWNPSANSTVLTLAIDANGNVYAGGAFTNIGGRNRSYIAKLSANGAGAADASWDPSSNQYVDTLAVDTSGDVYAGGQFTSIGGQGLSYLAKLPGTGTGAADASWNPLPNGPVGTLASDANGSIYASGGFTSIGGQSRSYLAKLSTTTGAADANWNPSPNGGVAAFAFDSRGNIYVAGGFNSIGGQSRSSLAKLSASGVGAVDVNWNPLPNVNSTAWALAVDVSGNVFVGGYFTRMGDQLRNGLAALPPPAYVVTTSAGANGALTLADTGVDLNNVLPGATLHFTVTPNAGYLVNVSGCGGTLSGSTYTTAPASANCTITAIFSAGFVSLNPVRLLDTRAGYTTSDGQFAGNGAVTAGGQIDLGVTGRGGVPPSGVVAVVLNVTATNPTAASYITAWPTGGARPIASNLNFTPGLTIANLVIAKVGASGKVSLYNAAGNTHLIADVAGYFIVGADLTSLSPGRLLDTRAGTATIDGQFQGIGALTAGETLDLTVSGRDGIPASGVGAVILNTTVTAPTAPGYLTLWSSGAARPIASNLNFTPGLTIPNLVIGKVGSNGKVSIYNSAGSTDVIADVQGWFPSASQLTALSPVRVMDTRPGMHTIDEQFAGTGALSQRSTSNLTVLGRGGVPSSGVDSVVLNLTVTEPSAVGYLTAWPTGSTQPNASNLNFNVNQTIPNLVIAKVGNGGQVSLYNGSSGTMQVVVDVVGYFATP